MNSIKQILFFLVFMVLIFGVLTSNTDNQSNSTFCLCNNGTAYNCTSLDAGDDVIYDITDLYPKYEDLMQDNITEANNLTNESVVEMTRRILNTKLNTNCKFIVGLDSQAFESHRSILSASGPIFKTFFTGREAEKLITVKLPDISANAFEVILDYIYTKETCLDNFDTACELIKIAPKFQLDELEKEAIDYLYSKLDMTNIWEAYHCVIDAKNDKVKDSVLLTIARNANETLIDPKFLDISHDMLIDLLKRDDLNIKENLILDSTIRWAMANLEKQNITITPESIRATIGSAISLIRFLSFTADELANMQCTSKILSYRETLAITLNLNLPNVTELPENISQSRVTRKYSESSSLPLIYVRQPQKCTKTNIEKLNIQNDFSRSMYATSSNWNNNNREQQEKFVSVKVPSRVCRNGNENEQYEENLIVKMFSSNRTFTTSFNKMVTCGTIMDIKFEEKIYLPKRNDCTFKVMFLTNGFYPKLSKTFFQRKQWPESEYIGSQYQNNKQTDSYFINTYKFSIPGFIHSIVTHSASNLQNSLGFQEYNNKIISPGYSDL